MSLFCLFGGSICHSTFWQFLFVISLFISNGIYSVERKNSTTHSDDNGIEAKAGKKNISIKIIFVIRNDSFAFFFCSFALVSCIKITLRKIDIRLELWHADYFHCFYFCIIWSIFFSPALFISNVQSVNFICAILGDGSKISCPKQNHPKWKFHYGMQKRKKNNGSSLFLWGDETKIKWREKTHIKTAINSKNLSEIDMGKTIGLHLWVPLVTIALGANAFGHRK